jgi:Ca2+-binding RTX toxin-like protein
VSSFTFLSGENPFQFMTSSETGYLGAGAFLAGFSASGELIDIRIYGAVLADPKGGGGIGIAGTGNTLVVGRTGTIDNVSETIDLTAAVDVFESGVSAVTRVSNAGQINGNVAGLYMFVQETSSTIRLLNSGTITGEVAGVLVQGVGRTVISNSGTIEGFVSGVASRTSIFQSDTPASITNTGTIRGADAAILLTGGDDRIINRGLLDGAVSTGGNADNIDNRGGRIEGAVSMGDGSDLFDNRGGAVFESFIDLGAGDDIFRPGAEAENVEGGEGTDDRIDLRHGSGGVISLIDDSGTGLAAGDSYAGFEVVIGARAAIDTIIGNSAANQLFGLGGADVLSGGTGADTLTGGAGKDRLTGGGGNDTFAFDRTTDFGDLIADFANATGNNDRFTFNASEIGLSAGTLDPTQFRSGTSNLAGDANDRFIFRTTDKTLWFDANGTGAGGLALVADLQPSALVTAADIVLT